MFVLDKKNFICTSFKSPKHIKSTSNFEYVDSIYTTILPPIGIEKHALIP